MKWWFAICPACHLQHGIPALSQPQSGLCVHPWSSYDEVRSWHGASRLEWRLYAEQPHRPDDSASGFHIWHPPTSLSDWPDATDHDCELDTCFRPALLGLSVCRWHGGMAPFHMLRNYVVALERLQPNTHFGREQAALERYIHECREVIE